MKQILFKATLLIMGFVFSINTQASNKIQLRMNLKKGSSYEFVNKISSDINQVAMGQEINMTQNMDLTYTCHVDDKKPNGDYVISYTIENLEMTMDINGQTINYSSAENSEDNAFAAVFNELKGFKISFELSSKGKVSNIKGITEYLNKINSNKVAQQALGQFTDDKTFAQYIAQAYGFFPDKAVAEGDTWTSSITLPSLMNMEITLKYNLNKIEEKEACISINSDINIEAPIEKQGVTMDLKAKGSQKGIMNVNRNDGMINNSTIEQLFDMTISMINPQNGENMDIPMKVITKVEVKVNRN